MRNEMVKEWSYGLQILFMASALLGPLVGCRDVPPYTAIIRNTSNEKITEAKIVLGEYALPGGNVVPRGEKGTAYPPVPITEIATVHWRTADGVIHEKNVAVKALLPRRASHEEYEIYFDVDGENVKVSVKTKRIPR